MSETPKAPTPEPWATWIDRVLDRIPPMDDGSYRVSVRYAKAEIAALRSRLSAAEAAVASLRAVAVAVVAHRTACEQRWKDYDRMMVEAGATRVPDDDADPWPDYVALTDALAAARAAGALGEGTHG